MLQIRPNDYGGDTSVAKALGGICRAQSRTSERIVTGGSRPGSPGFGRPRPTWRRSAPYSYFFVTLLAASFTFSPLCLTSALPCLALPSAFSRSLPVIFPRPP